MDWEREVSRLSAKFWPAHLSELSCLLLSRILVVTAGLETVLRIERFPFFFDMLIVNA